MTILNGFRLIFLVMPELDALVLLPLPVGPLVFEKTPKGERLASVQVSSVRQTNQSDCPVRGRARHFKRTGSCGRRSFPSSPLSPLPLRPTFVGTPAMQAKETALC